MSPVLIAGVASIMLSLAALPPHDESVMASDLKAAAGVHHAEAADAHRTVEPGAKLERQEVATERPACAAGRDAAKPPCRRARGSRSAS